MLLDVVQGDPHWADGSLTRLEWAAEHGKRVINPIVYAEFSVWYDVRKELAQTLAGILNSVCP
ncbi:hypothetical protein NOC27_1987 [Nitrosococcus oceani AFC27]|nr:hypothetical protein NOC27_1987 [Nitrosococcus oceani AFC27]